MHFLEKFKLSLLFKFLLYFCGCSRDLNNVEASISPNNSAPYVDPLMTNIIMNRACQAGSFVTQSFQVPVHDADNNIVRCRCTNNKCLSMVSVNQDTCEVNVTLNSTVTGYIVIELQIEDFATSTSTNPLSSVTVMFLIEVQTICRKNNFSLFLVSVLFA